MNDDMTDDDIAASTVTHENGITPKSLLSEIAQARRKTMDYLSQPMPPGRQSEAVASAVLSSDPAGAHSVNLKDATILQGEQHAAHVAFQAAAKELKEAQAKLGEAQATFRSCIERMCKASEQS